MHTNWRHTDRRANKTMKTLARSRTNMYVCLALLLNLWAALHWRVAWVLSLWRWWDERAVRRRRLAHGTVSSSSRARWRGSPQTVVLGGKGRGGCGICGCARARLLDAFICALSSVFSTRFCEDLNSNLESYKGRENGWRLRVPRLVLQHIHHIYVCTVWRIYKCR